MSSDIIVVDEQDNLIGHKQRDTITHDDIYRVSGLWLTDTGTGDVLLSQRKWTKKHDPGKWSFAAVGTNDKGETYEQNIVKEAAEELGLTKLAFRRGPKQFIDDGQHRLFCQWFLAQIDKDKVKLTIQDEEIEGVKWVSLGDLIHDFNTHPDSYVPSIYETMVVLGVVQP